MYSADFGFNVSTQIESKLEYINCFNEHAVTNNLNIHSPFSPFSIPY